MKKALNTVDVIESSGNVFADLGVSDPQEALAKAKLASRICQLLKEQGLTQTKAAEILGLDQPKISALVRGKLKGFSTDRLFRFLNDLGQEVEIVVRPARKAGRRGGVDVLATV